MTTIKKVGLDNSVEYKYDKANDCYIFRVYRKKIKTSDKGNDIYGNAFWTELQDGDKLNLILIHENKKPKAEKKKPTVKKLVM